MSNVGSVMNVNSNDRLGTVLEEEEEEDGKEKKKKNK
jgi:hypothetical protein